MVNTYQHKKLMNLSGAGYIGAGLIGTPLNVMYYTASNNRKNITKIKVKITYRNTFLTLTDHNNNVIYRFSFRSISLWKFTGKLYTTIKRHDMQNYKIWSVFINKTFPRIFYGTSIQIKKVRKQTSLNSSVNKSPKVYSYRKYKKCQSHIFFETPPSYKYNRIFNAIKKAVCNFFYTKEKFTNLGYEFSKDLPVTRSYSYGRWVDKYNNRNPLWRVKLKFKQKITDRKKGKYQTLLGYNALPLQALQKLRKKNKRAVYRKIFFIPRLSKPHNGMRKKKCRRI